MLSAPPRPKWQRVCFERPGKQSLTLPRKNFLRGLFVFKKSIQPPLLNKLSMRVKNFSFSFRSKPFEKKKNLIFCLFFLSLFSERVPCERLVSCDILNLRGRKDGDRVCQPRSRGFDSPRLHSILNFQFALDFFS